MPANTRWGKAGWGRTPGSFRRQAPPMFAHRHELDREFELQRDIRFASLASERSWNANWLTPPTKNVELGDESTNEDEMSA